MTLHTVLWACMQFHELAWSYISLHAVLWDCRHFNQLACGSMTLGCQFPEFTWSTMSLHAVPWACMQSDGAQNTSSFLFWNCKPFCKGNGIYLPLKTNDDLSGWPGITDQQVNNDTESGQAEHRLTLREESNNSVTRVASLHRPCQVVRSSVQRCTPVLCVQHSANSADITTVESQGLASPQLLTSTVHTHAVKLPY